MEESVDGDDEPPPVGDREIKGLRFKSLGLSAACAIDSSADYVVDIDDHNSSGGSELEDALQREVMLADLYQSSHLEPKELINSGEFGEMYTLTQRHSLSETVETEIMRSMLGGDGSICLFDSSPYDPSSDLLRLFIPYNGEDSYRKTL